jgi:hypothetical protein
VLYWREPALFGRNRESRTREAAGRRNWPEAVPKKMCGGKKTTYYRTQQESALGVEWRQQSERKLLTEFSITDCREGHTCCLADISVVVIESGK